MSSFVKVLKDGYSIWLDKDRASANGSCTLVKNQSSNILVDCLGPWDRDVLLEKLALEGLHPEDVSNLICTHGHPDHIGNLNMFTRAKHIVGTSIYERDIYTFHPFASEVSYSITEGVVVFATPGHTLSDVSVKVENVNKLGTVVIAGDLFENEKDLYNDEIWKGAGSESEQQQITNRVKVLKIADHIVPGHGAIFEVPKSLK